MFYSSPIELNQSIDVPKPVSFKNHNQSKLWYTFMSDFTNGIVNMYATNDISETTDDLCISKLLKYPLEYLNTSLYSFSVVSY